MKGLNITVMQTYLFNTIEIMNGMIVFLPLPRTQNLQYSRLPLNVHACGPYYINFSDCAAVADAIRCQRIPLRKAHRTEGTDGTGCTGDCRITQDPLLTQEHNLFYRIQNLLHCLKSFLSLRAVIQKKRYFLSQYRPFYCKRQPFLSGCKSRG